MIAITSKEQDIITNLKAQEQLCVEKYKRNKMSAKDPVLKDLFGSLEQSEQKHLDALNEVSQGTVPNMAIDNEDAKNYNPVPTYVNEFNQSDKDNDQFLCTDTITTEKYVASAYNFNLFQFADTNVRKLLNDIETEEQTHAEKIHKYKVANNMN